MKVFDLHCDTLYKAVTMSHGFSCSDYEVQTDVDFEKYLQCFAVWIPDDLSIKQGRALFEKAKITLPKECKINNINLVDSFKEINNSTKTCRREQNESISIYSSFECILAVTGPSPSTLINPGL